MVMCGHQLRSSDDSDWLFCSSAVAPLGGDSSTSHIINSLMEERYSSDSTENLPELHTKKFDTPYQQSTFLQSRKIKLTVSEERLGKYQQNRGNRLSQRNIRQSPFYDFTDFDESEHFEGCPMKWLYRRQSSGSIRSVKSYATTIDSKSPHESINSSYRDKIPREIQIKRMGLRKRQNGRKRKTKHNHETTSEMEAERSGDELDIHLIERKAKLAAKLNFRPFNPENADSCVESYASYRNCFPSRTLTGSGPWLYILLAPRLDNCCNSHSVERRVLEAQQSPRVSIRSISLPQLAKPRAYTTPLVSTAARWASKKRPKHEKEQKILQTPPQHTIKLRDDVAPRSSVVESPNPALLEEDRFFRLRRFLNLDNPQHPKKVSGEDDKSIKVEISKKERTKATAFDDNFKIMCNKVQFFERSGKPMR